MNSLFTIHRFLLSIFLTTNVAFAATGASRAESWTTVSLLENRLSVLMPPGSKIEAVQPSVMGAAESGSTQTRVIYDEGGKRLVLMAVEMFFLGSDDLASELQKQYQDADVPKEQWPEIKRVDSKRIRVLPVAINDQGSGQAYYLEGLYYTNFDKTVQKLDVLVNPAFYADRERAETLAKEILASVKDGSRKLELAARTVQTAMLEIDIPMGYVHTFQEGPDSRVDRIERLAALNESGDIGIYIGAHPSLHSDQYEEGQIEKTMPQYSFLGKEMHWIRYAPVDQPGLISEETMVKLHDLLRMHVWIAAHDEARLEELRRVVQTARISEEGRAIIAEAEQETQALEEE